MLNKNDISLDEPKIPKDWGLYNKKIKRIIVIIFLLFVIFLILSGFIIGIKYYRDTFIDLDNKNIVELNNYIKVVKSQIKKTNNNVSLARKYSKRWENISKNQKDSSGISIEKIDQTIKKLSDKYLIKNYNLDMSVPKKAQPKDKIDFYVSICKISFKIIDDIRLQGFLQDLENELVGYIVINQLSVRKAGQYQFRNLLEISEGSDAGLLQVSINFQWFVGKDK